MAVGGSECARWGPNLSSPCHTVTLSDIINYPGQMKKFIKLTTVKLSVGSRTVKTTPVWKMQSITLDNIFLPIILSCYICHCEQSAVLAAGCWGVTLETDDRHQKQNITGLIGHTGSGDAGGLIWVMLVT